MTDSCEEIQKWLDIGTKIEMEHTSDPVEAKKIAKDHLDEFGIDYYRELVQMEEKLKERQSKSKEVGIDPVEEWRSCQPFMNPDLALTVEEVRKVLMKSKELSGVKGNWAMEQHAKLKYIHNLLDQAQRYGYGNYASALRELQTLDDGIKNTLPKGLIEKVRALSEKKTNPKNVSLVQERNSTIDAFYNDKLDQLRGDLEEATTEEEAKGLRNKIKALLEDALKNSLQLGEDFLCGFQEMVDNALGVYEIKYVNPTSQKQYKLNNGDTIVFARGGLKGIKAKVSSVDTEGKIFVTLQGIIVEVAPSQIVKLEDEIEKKSNPATEEKALLRAFGIYEKWYDRQHELIKDIEIVIPDDKDRLNRLGIVVQVDYISDKKTTKGKKDYYYHPVEQNSPEIYAWGNPTKYSIAGIQEARPEGLVETTDKKAAKTGQLPPQPSACVRLGDLAQIIYLTDDGEFVCIRFKNCDLLCDETGMWIYIAER